MAEGPDTRQRLLDAAIRTIAARGESALRMTEIAEEAGIRQPSIYHFFESREALVVAAHREMYLRAVLDVVETYEDLVGKATTQEEFIEASLRGLEFAFSDDRIGVRAARVLLLAKGLSNADLLGEVNQAAFESNQRLAVVLENAQRQGWIRNDVTPLTLAVWVRSQVIGRFLLEVDRKRYDGEEWTRLALSSIESTLLSGVDRPGKGR